MPVMVDYEGIELPAGEESPYVTNSMPDRMFHFLKHNPEALEYIDKQLKASSMLSKIHRDMCTRYGTVFGTKGPAHVNYFAFARFIARHGTSKDPRPTASTISRISKQTGQGTATHQSVGPSDSSQGGELEPADARLSELLIEFLSGHPM